MPDDEVKRLIDQTQGLAEPALEELGLPKELLPQSLGSFLAEPAPRVRLLAPGLEAGTLGVIAGPPNGAKTWGTLALARAVRDRGHRVLLIPEEGGKGRYQYRCRANDLGTRANINGHAGRIDILWKKGFRIEGEPWDKVMPTLMRHYDLVFIDPLGYAHDKDESNQQEMNQLWGLMKHWRDASQGRRDYPCALWAVHYTHKLTWPKEAVPQLANIHGSNVITRYVDAAIIIKTIGDGQDEGDRGEAPTTGRVDHFEVHGVKMRDGALPEPISMDLHQVRAVEDDGQEAVDENRNPVFTARVELGGLAWKAKRERSAARTGPELLTLLLAADKPLTASALRKKWKEAHKGTDINPARVLQPALKWLKSQHLVMAKDDSRGNANETWEPTLKARATAIEDATEVGTDE